MVDRWPRGGHNGDGLVVGEWLETRRWRAKVAPKLGLIKVQKRGRNSTKMGVEARADVDDLVLAMWCNIYIHTHTWSGS